MTARSRANTPVRSALRKEPPLQASVRDGVAALLPVDRARIDERLRAEFADSLDLDAATREGREQEHRWDYLLGHGPTASVVALEPHGAIEKEVQVIIEKRRASRDRLRSELKEGQFVKAWFWVASGSVGFPDTDRTRRRLDQEGITFVGRNLLPRHIDKLPR